MPRDGDVTALVPPFLTEIGFSCFRLRGWGRMKKSRFPPWPGETGEGVSIYFRPQACSLPWRGPGSRVVGPLRAAHQEPPVSYPRPVQSARDPASPPGGPLLSLGSLGAGFVYSLHAPPAWPMRGERRLTSLMPKANRRSPCCSAAKARAGEAGQWRGRERADEAASALCCSRRSCSVSGARPDPSSLGRLEVARARGRRPGASNSRASTGQAADRPPCPECKSTGTWPPPSAGATGAAAPEDAPQARRRALRGRLVLCNLAAVRSRARARAPCRGPLDSARRVPGQVSLHEPPAPLQPRVPSVYSHAFFQASPSNP